MGVCTSDPLTYLIKEYGADVCKYIVSIKAEDYVDQVVPKLTEKVQDEFKRTGGNLDKEFDSKQNSMKENFNSSLSEIKKSNPSALDKVKTSQKKNEQQLFGFDNFEAQFAKLKNTKDSKLKDQESNILSMLQKKKEELKKNIRDSRPSLPLFDSMPVCLRQKVLSQGEEKFAPQIKQKQTHITEMFDNITNLGNLEESIKKVAGLNEADKLVKNSSSTFEKAKKMITTMADPQAGMKSCCFG